jgi:glucose/mannose-6-phosphate isomerase
MAHELDDRSFVTRLDPKGMLRLTEDFPNQCRTALAIAMSAPLPSLDIRPGLVMLTGLGGSAAGGDFTRAIFEAQGTSPFIVNRDYHLPNFVGLSDLVFVASYSGNTEETLSAYADAVKAGAKIICITSGGKLAELAKADGHSIIQIPGGQPPRTALGFMLIPVLVAAERLKLIPKQDFEAAFALVEKLIPTWSVDSPYDQNDCKQLAEALHEKLAVLYGLGSWQAVIANRWKGQINENAKNLAFANGFPELNHNEILGWVRANAQSVQSWVAVILSDGTESDKMKTRAKVTEQLVGPTADFHHIQARGENLLQRMLTLAVFGDFVSLYLAALNGIDPENIDAINTLKSELSKVAS